MRSLVRDASRRYRHVNSKYERDLQQCLTEASAGRSRVAQCSDVPDAEACGKACAREGRSRFPEGGGGPRFTF